MAGGLRGGIIFRRGFLTNFWAGWGRIEVTICDRAGKLDRTAPVDDINNTTINERMRGWGLEQPGDGVAPSFFEGDFCEKKNN